jgi:hypothetical protein
MRSTPQTPPHRRDRLGEGGLLCRVPGCRADRSVLGPDQRGRHQGYDGVEPKHTRRRAGHAPVTRLPGCCDASIGSGLCNGRLERPALDEPGEELHRVAIQRRRQQRLWRKRASWIADEDPPNRHRWPARVIPDGGGGAAVDMTCCVGPYHGATVTIFQGVVGAATRGASAASRRPRVSTHALARTASSHSRAA